MIHLLFFGITQDIVNQHKLDIKIDKSLTVSELKNHLFEQFPALQKFPTFTVAVNEHYATDDTLINDKDVVAIIPPVSGG